MTRAPDGQKMWSMRSVSHVRSAPGHDVSGDGHLGVGTRSGFLCR